MRSMGLNLKLWTPFEWDGFMSLFHNFHSSSMLFERDGRGSQRHEAWRQESR